ncbi:DUF2184 domain-containing protein [Paenibacillus agricola]|uniref:DUF2184 domain-containing protein n=1 Tax=Paenibacillus agricola TaxID=2716264 RepID=A0ABX0JI35_9BACL|nr:DUF2184 domain-containing protein [Paenibacillus agricola]NHN33536.1 DUF2184 domain-containing protein [Paenibacillus agricola]
MAMPKAPKTFSVPVSPMFMNDAAIGGGMAFLNGELEKRDPRLLEPLSSVTWQRDIVAKTGGGWVDFTSNMFVDYATTGGNESGIIGGETNDIPIMQANTSKDLYKVFNFANILKVPFVDQQKMQTIGRSLDDILDKGIRLNYNKSVDNIVYTGVASMGIYGLINNPAITAATVPNGAAGTATWATKTPDEILNDINQALVATWAASEYDLTGMGNHILIPPVQYAYIVSTKVSGNADKSILQYLLDNNIGKNQGVDVFIGPSRWCTAAGASSKDRMMVYANNEDRINFDLPVALSRVMTQPQVTEMAYLTAYAAQIGQVKVLYTQCAVYRDGI